MVGQLTETQSNMDEKLSCHSTEQRRLIMEIIQQARGHLDAEVRLVGYCPDCQQWLLGNMTDTKQE